ncbi:MAG TPA: hypothetical protein VFQ39_07330, partial [Longimicrobium sp.]|nr:hypothetical protein [Longimicrobium sp.]
AAWLLPAALLATSGGCLAAAAGAGAAGGIYLSDQGASGIVNGPVDQVAGRTPGVLSSMGIEVTGHGTEDNGTEHTWEGKRGDLDIKVEVKRESASTTRVNASARKNVAEWDKDYARSIVQRIVQAGG